MSGRISVEPAIVLPSDEGEEIRIGDSRIVLKAVSPRVTVFDYTGPPYFGGPPLHIHPGFDEVYVVLEGTLALHLRDEVHELGLGSSASIEGAMPHTFSNPTAEPLRFLSICAPGGFEQYFRSLANGNVDEAIAEASERFGYTTLEAP